MKRVEDLRIKTLDDAKIKMAGLAKITAVIALEKARAAKKISTIQAALQEKLGGLEPERELQGSALGAFIKANLGLFKKPRKVKCESGSFGLEAAKGVNITDEETLIQHLMDNGYDDCYETIRKPNKKAIKARLEADCALPGVTLASGDTVVYKVSPALIKEYQEGLG